MGYQALLFCPDEKTARTVTQVLSELEFSVESCLEPFAAVKKLMGQHFDAVVVDCDNEQNATLLFKSARNSASNQTSLAVAVVEGQAGVAKAFRIGANLVLTKPINIEQAKGTLRVARGLLRKGEPAKPASAAPAVPAPKPVAAKSVPPLKSFAPATPQAEPAHIPAPLPAAPPLEAKPAEPQAWPATASTSLVPGISDDDLLDLGPDDSIAAPSVSALSGDSQAGKSSASDAEAIAAFRGLASARGGGAASAPAPAREVPSAKAANTVSEEDNILSLDSVEAAPSAPSTHVGAEPSFTFGGANAPEKSSGGGKKIIFGVAAAAFLAGAIYIGWTVYQGRASQPVSTPAQTEPVSVPASQPAKPSSGQPASITPKTSAPASPSSSVPSSQSDSSAAKKHAAENSSDDDAAPVADSKAAAAPLVLKGGKSPAARAKTVAEPDAPSVIGIATPGASAPPPNIGGETSGPAPVLQTLNVSQGVSQGLLTRKVQPTYPRNALSMRIEGSVELLATISKTGDISKLKVVSGDPQLAKAATEAVKQWKYKPYLLNGEPVEIQTQVTINFKLPK